MVTAKKTSTSKPVAAVAVVPAPAPAKAASAKKPAVKKSASAALPGKVQTAAVTAMPPVVKSVPKTKAVAKPKASPAKTKAALSAEQRNHYVQVAAFYIAERRGFAPGNPADDWAAAEAEVDRLIASNNFAT